MIRFLFMCLLLIYYWYFYASGIKDVNETTIDKPLKPYNVLFDSKQPNHFQFVIDGKVVWEHTLPMDTFKFYQNKIVPIDPCHGHLDGQLIPAKGQILYEYLKENPETNVLKFVQNGELAIQRGEVFYFKCSKGYIERIGICPSGTILLNGNCQSVNSCTNMPNNTRISSSQSMQHYIECVDGKEHVKTCPDKFIFYHDRCENEQALIHYCNTYPGITIKYDDVTRLKCIDGKPFFKTCKSGTRLFDNVDQCEPANCFGLSDGTKIPLPTLNNGPFNFIPGYISCLKGKIETTVECPQNWDEMLTKDDDLTFLPMVFDGIKCSIPTFCENVFSDESDIIVPAHDFTKHIKNWKFSKIFDVSVGYTCENNKTRKRKILPAGFHISKKFKIESACEGQSTLLPIYDRPDEYYDCDKKVIVSCPPSHFFDGYACASRPNHAFDYRGIPLFKFDSLNLEHWIKPFDYSKDVVPTCKDNESTFIKLYNICSHPDCELYAFVSQIPDMAILLPTEQGAKCKYYESEKVLKKEPVKFKYHFWSQRMVDDYEEICKPGQKISTGNFIWDSTIFATCNPNQPFVFCPSKHTTKIIQVNNSTFACEPPTAESYEYSRADWYHFETNEIKRILPTKDGTVFKLSKSDKPTNLPKEGVTISENRRINLFTPDTVKVEPRFRVTYPPNVAFEYDNQQNMNTLSAPSDQGFLIKLKSFTHKAITLPRHEPLLFVKEFERNMYV